MFLLEIPELLGNYNLLTADLTTLNHFEIIKPAVIPPDIRLYDDFIADLESDFVCYRNCRLN